MSLISTGRIELGTPSGVGAQLVAGGVVRGSMTKQPSERRNITPGSHKSDFAS